MNERERIRFIFNRDGKDAAREWAKQTLAIYEQEALQQSKHWESISSLRSMLAGWEGLIWTGSSS